MNAHNEQHDSASPVVKQNLTTQPAAAQEAAVWQWRNLRAETGWKDCTRAVYDVFRQNGLHYEVRKLYAAPVTAAPVDCCPHCGGTAGHWEGCRAPVDAPSPAAPGIGLQAFRKVAMPLLCQMLCSHDAESVARKLHAALLDASPKGGSEACERIAAMLHQEATDEPWTVCGVEHDGPDRAYYRELARRVLDAAQAGDAEVQP